MLCLLLLPFRLIAALVFGVLMLPFLIIRTILKLLAAILLLPLLLLFGFAVLLIGGAALLIPLIPILMLGLLCWAILRWGSRAAPI